MGEIQQSAGAVDDHIAQRQQDVDRSQYQDIDDHGCDPPASDGPKPGPSLALS